MECNDCAVSERAWSIAIFVSALAFYLLTTSREPAWGDARSMWDVADHLVSRGEVITTVRWPDDAPTGRGGHYYGISPLGPSLVHVPGAALTRMVAAGSPAHARLARPLLVHLAPAALGALTCVLFFWLLVELGRSRRTASVATVILACATTTWVYARMPYSEILQATCFLGLFRQALRVCEQPTRRQALWLGLWAGSLLHAKYVFALAIVGCAGLLVLGLRRRRAELWRTLGVAALAGLPFAALALGYNWVRWGSVTQTGYEPYLGAYFGGDLFDGLWGMVASPNKSMFLYSPPLVLAALALPRAVRAAPRYGLGLLTMVLPVFLVYCSYRSWSGEYAWGPRFAVWMVPVLLVPLAWALDAAHTRWQRALVLAVVASGVAVQLLGSALYWDHFIRVAIRAKNEWLGQPDRSGSYIAERSRGHCDSCFEDTYPVLWTPAFQPIAGNLWLLRSLARGDSAVEAQASAPWRTYTTLTVDLGDTYDRARIDWWGLLWIKDVAGTTGAGLGVLAAFLAALLWGLGRWRRLWRAAADERGNLGAEPQAERGP